MLVNRAAAHQSFLKVEGMMAFASHRIQHTHGFADHFRADAVTGQKGNFEFQIESPTLRDTSYKFRVS
jgi:hypothetical protein